MKRRVLVFGAIIIGLVAVFSLSLARFVVRWFEPEEISVPEIPQLALELNEVTLEEIKAGSKTTRYSGNTLVLTSGDEQSVFGDVEVKGRGNSTWTASKRPFQVKLSRKISFLGMAPARKWVLLANAYDKSMLRNDTGLYLAEMLGERYLNSGEYVELMINGEEQGLYYVAPKVEIDKNRVALKDEFGVLVELDNLYAGEGAYIAVDGGKLAVSDLVADDNEKVAMEDFVQAYDALYLAAQGGDYSTVEKMADVESLARYYLISEFTQNPDAYSTSCYFYKDGQEDKIHAGPAWDFDFALGNPAWGWGRIGFHSPFLLHAREAEAFGGEVRGYFGETITYSPDTSISRLYYYLARMPEFQNEVKNLFLGRMRGRIGEILARLEEKSKSIRVAAEQNMLVWSKEEDDDSNKDGEAHGGDEFMEAVQALTDWVRMRYEFFDYTYTH